MKKTSREIIVLFDGVCNLCNGAVQFIIKRDPRGVIRFASLQSDTAKELLKRFGLNSEALHSILVIEGDRIFDRSDAAFKIIANLSSPWPILTCLKIFPRFLRDGVYNWIARNRYRVFGQRDECMIPSPELKSRFL